MVWFLFLIVFVIIRVVVTVRVCGLVIYGQRYGVF